MWSIVCQEVLWKINQLGLGNEKLTLNGKSVWDTLTENFKISTSVDIQKSPAFSREIKIGCKKPNRSKIIQNTESMGTEAVNHARR